MTQYSFANHKFTSFNQKILSVVKCNNDFCIFFGETQFLTNMSIFICRFIGAIKQYLCLSILKNSAVSVMSIFQLLCSLFISLLSRFRSGLKGEIGIFFPMLLLRVLENVLQPSYLQKLTVLNSLEKIFQDPQIIIDIFVNYDCDVDAPNIFERYEDTLSGLI